MHGERAAALRAAAQFGGIPEHFRDRKSTRLNSSHLVISYAVFCLKKKRRMFSVLVIRLRSLRLLRVSGIVMRLRMFLLLITFLKASHSFRNRLLVICKNAYLFATMIMTSVSSPFSCCSGIVRLNFFLNFTATPRPLPFPPRVPFQI